MTGGSEQDLKSWPLPRLPFCWILKAPLKIANRQQHLTPVWPAQWPRIGHWAHFPSRKPGCAASLLRQETCTFASQLLTRLALHAEDPSNGMGKAEGTDCAVRRAKCPSEKEEGKLLTVKTVKLARSVRSRGKWLIRRRRRQERAVHGQLSQSRQPPLPRPRAAAAAATLALQAAWR